MPAAYCDQCKYFVHGITTNYVSGKQDIKIRCEKGHKPRFYMPKSDNPLCNDWGWKRNCEDYEAKSWNTKLES
jgi:hypothetical protein